MKAIHLSNAKKRDAQVAFETRAEEKAVRLVLPNGEEKVNVRILKATVQLDEDALAEHYGNPEKVAHAIMESDPEIDMEIIGKKLRRTHRVYVDKNNRIAYRVKLFRIVRNPDGTEKERHDVSKLPGNINVSIPLRWTGRKFPKTEAIRKFVFTRKYQISHINGVTYDFLYGMAKELHTNDSLMLIGGGPKGTDPVLLTRGGAPYRGFLEGRINGDKYCLILHLTDIELKGL